MFATNFEMLLISQVLCAFSFIIKGTCESTVAKKSQYLKNPRKARFKTIAPIIAAFAFFLDVGRNFETSKPPIYSIMIVIIMEKIMLI